MSLPLPSLDQLQPAEFDAGELFSGQTSGRMVKGYKSPCLHTPIWDPHNLFHDAMRQVVVWFLDPTDPLYVWSLGASAVRSRTPRRRFSPAMTKRSASGSSTTRVGRR